MVEKEEGVFFPVQPRAVARSGAGPVDGQHGGCRRPWRVVHGRRRLAPRLPRSLRRGLGMLRLRWNPAIWIAVTRVCLFFQSVQCLVRHWWLDCGSSDLV
jgi:hypothetical protein